jgi:hypothetical protein
VATLRAAWSKAMSSSTPVVDVLLSLPSICGDIGASISEIKGHAAGHDHHGFKRQVDTSVSARGNRTMTIWGEKSRRVYFVIFSCKHIDVFNDTIVTAGSFSTATTFIIIVIGRIVSPSDSCVDVGWTMVILRSVNADYVVSGNRMKKRWQMEYMTASEPSSVCHDEATQCQMAQLTGQRAPIFKSDK